MAFSAMRKQLKVLRIAAWLLVAGAGFAVAEGEDPYGEPSANYLRQFREEGAKTFVLERFDAEGRLAARSVEKLDGEVEIGGPVERTIAGRRVTLRGLNACPTEKVVYNRVQSWKCADAARDYAEAVYRRASVILCKTLVLTPAAGETTPASCFVLVGGKGESFKTANDDDSMVFLGLAAIGRTPDGRSRRPDLEASQSLSRSMGFQNAD
jgi:hypothetical protein